MTLELFLTATDTIAVVLICIDIEMVFNIRKL